MMEPETLLAFGELPFHIGPAESPTNRPFPDVLPFGAGYRAELGLLVQLPNAQVVAELDRVYRRGSMLGTPLSAEGFGREYADDFLRFIVEVIRSPKGRSVLEIGCGTGYLLRRLRELGADVLGVEPGEQARLGAVENEVSIIQAPFQGPAQFGTALFDVILHHGVLEHVPDPIAFMRDQRQMLSRGGHVIVGVPNEEPYIRSGDISTLSHEHWSFFTRGSLLAVMARSGLLPTRVEEATFGGGLYAASHASSIQSITVEGDFVRAYGIAARAKLDGLDRFLRNASERGRSVGLWPAARAFNYLHVLKPEVEIRIFDDDQRLTGKYYPPVRIPVESRSQMIERPVDDVVILTRAFGPTLREELEAIPALSPTTIRLLDEIGG